MPRDVRVALVRDIPMRDNFFEQVFTKTEAEHCLDILDDGCTTFQSRHRYRIRAKAPSRFFLREYFWTGGNHDDPLLETVHDIWGHPKHRLHGPVIKDGDDWRLALVDLGRTLRIGDEDEVTFVHSRLFNYENRFEPILAHTVTGGTLRVRLAVTFPSSLARRATVFAEDCTDARRVISTFRPDGAQREDHRTEFVYTFESPAEHRICQIRWELAGVS